MNKERPKLLIEAAFNNPRASLCRDTIFIPNQPLDLKRLAKAGFETEEDENIIYDEGIHGVFEKIGWPYDTLIAFYWQSMGPMVWECRLNALRLEGDTGLVCLEQDAWPSSQAIALVRRLSDRAVMSAFFKTLIDQNGAAFGVGLFGSLPSDTDNMSERIIPERVVHSAYWRWMNWAERVLDTDWHGFAEAVSARAGSPIMYPLELLKKYSVCMKDDLKGWLEKRKDRNGQLSERAKRAIFEAYFKQSYRSY